MLGVNLERRALPLCIALDGEDDVFDPRSVPLFVPVNEIAVMELTEAERNIDRFDQNRDQLAGLMGAACFVDNPARFDAMLREQSKHDLGAADALGNHLPKIIPAKQSVIPPYAEPIALQDGGQAMSDGSIEMRVAEKYLMRFISHGLDVDDAIWVR